MLIRWIVNTLALLLVSNVVPNIHYRSWVTLAIAAAVLGLLNVLVRPILYLITLPITILTLGLFLVILNAVMLKLAAALVPGFDVNGWWAAILGSLLLSIVSMVTDSIGRDEKR